MGKIVGLLISSIEVVGDEVKKDVDNVEKVVEKVEKTVKTTKAAKTAKKKKPTKSQELKPDGE